MAAPQGSREVGIDSAPRAWAWLSSSCWSHRAQTSLLQREKGHLQLMPMLLTLGDLEQHSRNTQLLSGIFLKRHYVNNSPAGTQFNNDTQSMARSLLMIARSPERGRDSPARSAQPIVGRAIAAPSPRHHRHFCPRSELRPRTHVRRRWERV